MSSNPVISFFPEPFCAPHNPVTKCTLPGTSVDCFEVFTRDSEFSSSIEAGGVWTFVILLVIGLFALIRIRFLGSGRTQQKSHVLCLHWKHPSSLSFSHTWDWSTPLIIAAALHNLFEWSIVFHVADEARTFEQFLFHMKLAVIWILSLIAVCIMIPDTLIAFRLEAFGGLVLDFGMPIMCLTKWFNRNNSPEVRSFYRLPALAHLIHILFSVLPLIVAGNHVGQVSWFSSFFLEAIFISAPITHVLYIKWSYQVDELRNKTKEPSEQDNDIEGEPTKEETAEDGLLPPEYRIKRWHVYIIVGLILGFMLPGLYITMVGKCPDAWSAMTTSSCLSSKNGPITRSSVAYVNRGYEDQFISLIGDSNLINVARNASGNLDYRVFQSENPPIREFRVIERWESNEALDEWIQNGPPSKVFETSEMRKALAGGRLTQMNTYREYTGCQ